MTVLGALIMSSLTAGSCKFMSISITTINLPPGYNTSNFTTVVPRPTPAPTATTMPVGNNTLNSTVEAQSAPATAVNIQESQESPLQTPTFNDNENVAGDRGSPWGSGNRRQRALDANSSSSNTSNIGWIDVLLADPLIQELLADYDNASNTFEATIGLHRWNPQFEGCREIDDTVDFDNFFATARTGAILAISFGCVALGLLCIEVLCCRYCCSRLILSLVLVMAFLGQLLTFVAYGTSHCQEQGDSSTTVSNKGYTCAYDDGTTLSIIALILYMVAGLLVCPTPKGKPILLVLVERERRQREQEQAYEPCCWCFMSPKNEKATDEEFAVSAAGAVVAVDPALQQQQMQQQAIMQQAQQQHQQQKPMSSSQLISFTSAAAVASASSVPQQNPMSSTQLFSSTAAVASASSFPNEVVVMSSQQHDGVSLGSRLGGQNSVEDMDISGLSSPPRPSGTRNQPVATAAASVPVPEATDRTVYSTAEVFEKDLYFDTEE
jgi:hypothetical protein